MLSLVLAPASAWANGFLELWFTRDQQAQWLFEQERYIDAAKVYEDPARRAAAYYRGGDFETAAALYGALRSPEAAYNRGNAQIMLGRYEEAIGSFDRALSARPDWPEAVSNREIARARLERLQPPEDDAGGTGGQLGADEIRFDDSGRVNEGGTEVTEQGSEPMSDQAMRAVWMRRVQSDPAEFLQARFAYQLFRDEQEEGGDASADR